jgi:SAM-dependent methyltransferase
MRAAQQERSSPPRYWMKLALFLVCAVAVLIGLDVANQALITLRQLDQIEADRDTWQRPADIMQALNLRPGDSVLDLGCGSGYFSFKLSDTVGPDGRVTADDIRRLSLSFSGCGSSGRANTISLFFMAALTVRTSVQAALTRCSY